MKIELNGNDIPSIDDLHIAILYALYGKMWDDEDYGFNSNALWDELTSYPDEPLEIIWTNFSSSLERIGKKAEKVKELLEDFAQERKDVTFQLN